MVNPLRETLQKIKWDININNQINEIIISFNIIIDGKKKEVILPYSQIRKIGKYFIYFGKENLPEDEWELIPLHRVIYVKNNKTGHFFYVNTNKK